MGYLWTGYVLTWAAVIWFAWRLESRARATARRLEEETRGGSDAPPMSSEDERVRA